MPASSGAASPATTAKKGKKKTKVEWYYYAGGVAVVGLGYYLYKQHQANAANAAGATPSSGAIDPLTGQPYAPGVGSLSGSGSTGSSGIDPATNLPYASELATSQGALTQAQADLQSQSTNFADAFAAFETALGTGGTGGQVNPQRPQSPVTGHPTKTLAQWIANATAQLSRLKGVNPAQAAQAVRQFLAGQPITNAIAAKGLHNIAKTAGNLGAPPVANGAHLPIVVAKAPKTPSTPAPRNPAPRAPAAPKTPVRSTVNSTPAGFGTVQVPRKNFGL